MFHTTVQLLATADPDDAVTSLGWLAPVLIVGGLVLAGLLAVAYLARGGGSGDDQSKINGR